MSVKRVKNLPERHLRPASFHASLCPKCSDRGWVFEFVRSKGKIAGMKRIRCMKNCRAARAWDGRSL